MVSVMNRFKTTIVAVASLAALALLSVTVVTGAQAAAGTQLFQGGRNAAYSRVVQLSDGSLLAAHIVEYGDNDGEIRLYRSTDGGARFSFVRAYRDGAGRQIGTPDLIEVSPGAVLMAYAVWDDADFGAGETLKVARSTDRGSTWSVTSVVERPPVWNWEPEFARSSDGRLQLYYSYAASAEDTPDAITKQTIARRESTDGGLTWGPRVIALGSPTGANFGMARVTRCGGTYYLAAEHYDDGAAVTVTTSSDGKTWAGASGWRVMEVDGDGWMFSTPEIACAGGALYGLGLAYNDWGFGGDENAGRVMLRSTDGARTWSEAPIVDDYDQDSDEANYSPTLLPLSSTRIFMITNSTTNQIRYGTATVR
jgi:hypothetical protein